MKKIKVLISLLVIIIAFAAFIAGYYLCNRKNGDQKESIKIGAILALSGESGMWGKNTQNGAELAVEEINANGGLLGRKLEIVYEDSKGNPNDAVAGVNKLISANKVQSIIGDVTSSNILAVAPICEKNKVILLNFGVAADITKAGDYIFRNWNSSASDAKFTSSFAIKNYKKIVVLNQNDSYGQSSKDSFINELSGKAVEIVYTGAFDRGQTDFRTLLNSFKSKSYDAIYVASYYKEALNILKQIKTLNVPFKAVLGTSEWEESSLTDFAKANYPGKIFYGYPLPPDSSIPIRKHFVEAYTKKFQKQPEILSDNGYDAILMLKYGIEKAGEYDATNIKDALYTLKDFQGASGLMSFDSNGDVDKPFGLRSITAQGLIWVNQ
jgi:branched-chain amino acid transport system substrate-binding protein